MPLTASALRADLYNLLDDVLQTGEPLVILRKGRLLRVVPDSFSSGKASNWFAKLPRREGVVNGDSDDLVSVDCSGGWNPDST